jgi:hypothetical protein
MSIPFVIFQVSLQINLAIKKEYDQCLKFKDNLNKEKLTPENKTKELMCEQVNIQYESCKIVHEQMFLIFKNRQNKYFKDLDDKSI